MIVICIANCYWPVCVDSSVVSSKVSVHLEYLLCMLTDSQLKAALIFVNSLGDIVAKAAVQKKDFVTEQLKVVADICSNLTNRCVTMNKLLAIRTFCAFRCVFRNKVV